VKGKFESFFLPLSPSPKAFSELNNHEEMSIAGREPKCPALLPDHSEAIGDGEELEPILPPQIHHESYSEENDESADGGGSEGLSATKNLALLSPIHPS